MKACLLFALILVSSSYGETTPSGAMLRQRQEVEVEVHGHRELWASGFSWSNLLFMAHVCGDPSTNCPHAPGPICGCPDCCKPVPPHIKHGYCLSHPCPSSGGEGSSEDDDDSGSSSSDSNEGDGDGEGFSANGSGSKQEATRTTSLWMYLAGAGALAGVGAAWMMRRRILAAAGAKKGLTDDEEEVEESNNMGLDGFDDGSHGGSFAEAASNSMRNLGLMVGGAAAAAAGAVGIAALSRRSNGSEPGEDVTGSVSRRYGMMSDGNGSVGYDETGARPEFIEVAPRSYYAAPAVIATSARGIEVEGPLRPSSHYTL